MYLTNHAVLRRGAASGKKWWETSCAKLITVLMEPFVSYYCPLEYMSTRACFRQPVCIWDNMNVDGYVYKEAIVNG